MNIIPPPPPPLQPKVIDLDSDITNTIISWLPSITTRMEVSKIWRNMNVIPNNMSCGVSFIHGLAGTAPSAIVNKILIERHECDPKKIREAFVIFSDVEDYYRDDNRNRRDTGGDALARYIRENNLGTILETEARINPNSGNKIKVWVWSPPHPSLSGNDKHIPVFGMKRVFDSDGDLMSYTPTPGISELKDSRFLDTRGEDTRGREA